MSRAITPAVMGACKTQQGRGLRFLLRNPEPVTHEAISRVDVAVIPVDVLVTLYF